MYDTPKTPTNQLFRGFRSASFAAGIFILAAEEDAALLSQGKDDDKGEGE